ncbi:zinc finger protein 501-like isoform X2 [Micropterus dolomieu]|uniref:zinc finger protein 501-like isoform X2 n=1 Tax=Micropterus dolomieu TaxID=147949 RepID=UPI001E8DF780|nr:zinc finger protein 501-like isoform X2 [Micropterus dolomieu]
MSSVDFLREFISERLTAAAEEIFGVFRKTALEYEEEIDRQRRLLDIVLKPEIQLHRTELPQQHVYTEEEFLADQQLCVQERNSSLDQEDPEPPQIKEEQEELCSSQEGEQLVLKQETDAFMWIPAYEESDDSEPEPNRDHQLLSHSSHVAERQDQARGKNEDSTRDADSEPQKRCNKSRSHRKQSTMLKNHHDTHTDMVKYKSTLQRQVERHKNSYVCEICGEGFMYMSGLKSHVTIHTGEKPYACKTCGKGFRAKSVMKIHMRTHTGEKPYLCTTCGKRFIDNSSLTKHMRIHTGEKPHTCKTCQRAFSRSGQLKAHMTIHTGEKPFLCMICGKTFCAMSGLKSHVTVHTGERPYACKICGTDFTRSSALKVHMRTHTGEKPYLCKVCGKRFCAMPAWKRHMGIHTGEKPYSCQTCGKRFCRTSELKSHVTVHTGERPYSCETCGKDFRLSSGLLVHIRRAHTDEKP